jgi:hypothetical protein
MIYPPPPEPEVVNVKAVEGSDQLGTSNFNPKLWMQKPRSWWREDKRAKPYTKA